MLSGARTPLRSTMGVQGPIDSGAGRYFPAVERSSTPCMRSFCLADVAAAPPPPRLFSPLGVLPGCTPSWSLRGMRGGLVDTNQSPFGTSIPSGLWDLPHRLPSCPSPFPHPWFMLQLWGWVPTSHCASQLLLPRLVPGPTAGTSKNWSSLWDDFGGVERPPTISK